MGITDFHVPLTCGRAIVSDDNAPCGYARDAARGGDERGGDFVTSVGGPGLSFLAIIFAKKPCGVASMRPVPQSVTSRTSRVWHFLACARAEAEASMCFSPMALSSTRDVGSTRSELFTW